MYSCKPLFALLLGACVAAGCNTSLPPAPGDDINTTDDDSGSPQPATEDQKQQAIADLETALASFPHESPEQDNELLAAAIQAQGSFASVVIGEGMVLATFTDGEEIAFFNDVPYEELSEAAIQTTQQKLDRSERHADADLFINAKGTGDTRVMVVNNSPAGSVDGQIAKRALDGVVGMSQKLGYGVSGPSLNSYANFTAGFQNMDCLIWFGHAGNAQGRFFFAIPVFSELTKEHPDIQNKLLIRSFHYDWLQGLEEFVAANELFVKQYWRFDTGGMLIMNTCYSGSAGAQAFRQACFTEGKLETFFGWTAKSRFTDMGETATVLFDLLAGANTNYAEYHPNAGSEPTRAWSCRTAHSNLGTLERKGFFLSFGKYVLTKSFTGLVNENESNLIYRRADGSESGGVDLDTVWEPGIQSLGVAESDVSPSTLSLGGSFGDQRDDGKVTINGHELSVQDWNQTGITCQIPNDGASAAGTVVVTRHGRESNPVNLTMWNGVVYYSENFKCSDPGKLEWNTTKSYSQEVQLRGDVHRSRSDPSSPPKALDSGAGAMQGVSKVTGYTTTGMSSEPHYDEQGNQVGTSVFTLSPGPAPSGIMSQIPGNHAFSVLFLPEEQKVKVMSGSLNLPDGEHVVREYQSQVVPSTDSYDQVLNLSMHVILSNIDPHMPLNMATFDTESLSLEKTFPADFNGINGASEGTVTYSIQVGPFTASHAPDANAAR